MNVASKNKTIVLCADDFGYNRGVSEGILQLVAKGRLSAVGCMVNFPYFNRYAEALLSYQDKVAVGLHLNLTEGPIPCSVHKLLLKTHLRLIDTKVIRQELEAQLDAFIATMGRQPDFIDGHQHVHQFPYIRSLLLDLCESRLQKKVLVRATYPVISPAPFRAKTAILIASGGWALHQQLQKRAIPHYACFGGVYDFGRQSNYRKLFRGWLSSAPAHSLIMCHPGDNRKESDSIAPARQRELDYFMSEDFPKDCATHQVTIAGQMHLPSLRA